MFDLCNIFDTATVKSLKSCPTLCDPIDGSPPGSPIPGILQARTLEWVAISFSNAWKWKVKVKSLSRVQPSATSWTAAYQAPPSMGFSRQESWSGVPLPSPIFDTTGHLLSLNCPFWFLPFCPVFLSLWTFNFFAFIFYLYPQTLVFPCFWIVVPIFLCILKWLPKSSGLFFIVWLLISLYTNIHIHGPYLSSEL